MDYVTMARGSIPAKDQIYFHSPFLNVLNLLTLQAILIIASGRSTG